jgi:hypothetical protein
MTELSKGAEDGGRFAKSLGQVAGRRLTYDELTGKMATE